MTQTVQAKCFYCRAPIEWSKDHPTCYCDGCKPRHDREVREMELFVTKAREKAAAEKEKKR